MIIKVNTLDDFETMIATCIRNKEHNVKVFVSTEHRPPNVSFGNEGKPYTKFTYILFSHLYQVVYSDKVKHKDYEILKQQFLEFQSQNADFFKIHIFKKIHVNYEIQCIEVEKELEVT